MENIQYCIVGVLKENEIIEAKILPASEAVNFVTNKRYEKNVDSTFSYLLNTKILAKFVWDGKFEL